MLTQLPFSFQNAIGTGPLECAKKLKDRKKQDFINKSQLDLKEKVKMLSLTVIGVGVLKRPLDGVVPYKETAISDLLLCIF